MRSALLLTLYFSVFFSSAHSQDHVTVLVRGESLTPTVLQVMEREVDADLTPAAISVTWKFGHDLDGVAVEGQLALVYLRGQCRTDAPPQGNPPASVTLGRTHVVDGHVLPIADILCDAVHNFIDRDLRVAAATDRDTLLGRALGRVTAHEFYHILLRTTGHSDRGLARFEQSASELLSPHNSFSAIDQRKISQFALASGSD